MPSSSSRSSSSSSSSSSSERHVVRNVLRRALIPDPLERPTSSHTSVQADAAADDDHQNEHSPLLSPSRPELDLDVDVDVREHPGREEDDEFQKTKSVWYLIVVTIGILGLQMAWAAELSNGSPYLLSLGLSKSHLSLAWIAGPLTGTVVQPLVGILSDNSRIPWGRRKPFILGGTIATVFFLLFLSWSKEIMAGVVRLFGGDPVSDGGKLAIVVVAVISIYFLDVALNTVQATVRAFIVECSPSHQQEQVNSMASRLLGIGNIIGFMTGYTDLTKYIWWLGHTQFQILSAIACIALCATVLLSTGTIRERDPTLDAPPPSSQGRSGVMTFFKRLFTSVKRLPPQTRNVCIVQFCAWIGLFPPLFYTTTFVADLYVQPYLEANPHMTPAELDELYERATRVGTFAMLIYSVSSLATNVILPSFIDPTFDNEPALQNRKSKGTKKYLQWLVIPGFTLKRAWMISHILFAAAMFCAPFIRTVGAANAIMGVFGITWAMTLWAPWAIISAEISRRDLLIRAQRQQRSRAINLGEQSTVGLRALDEDDGHQEEVQADNEANETGVIMGIHNMAIAAPQFLATIVCSIVFDFSEKPRGVPGDHSISIAFAVGGVFVFFASFLVLRIKDDLSVPADAIATLEGGGDAAGATGPANSAAAARSKGGRDDEARTSSEQALLARDASFDS